MTTRVIKYFSAALFAVTLTACSSNGHRAPVVERGASGIVPNQNTSNREAGSKSGQDWHPQTYIIQKGDTLYSIAFNYGIDYHELAELNNIQNPGLIHIGQEINLPATALASASPPIAAPAATLAVQPIPSSAANEVQSAKFEGQLPGVRLIEQPKVAKRPYSVQAMADMQKTQEAAKKTKLLAATKPVAQAKPVSTPKAAVITAVNGNTVNWGMPTKGKIIGNFSKSKNKGIEIAGKRGQAIVASAAGKVVYSGNGLRGYGKLVIIKHNSTYLSAYAHNSKILIKEGQTVTKGQKIAEMGDTDAKRVKLHFEIRKFGKPVDPASFLPLKKS